MMGVAACITVTCTSALHIIMSAASAAAAVFTICAGLSISAASPLGHYGQEGIL
jgi:hypothetical protein